MIICGQTYRYVLPFHQPWFSEFSHDILSRILIQNSESKYSFVKNQNRYSLSLMTWNDPLEAWFSIKAFHLSKKCSKTHNKSFFCLKNTHFCFSMRCVKQPVTKFWFRIRVSLNYKMIPSKPYFQNISSRGTARQNSFWDPQTKILRQLHFALSQHFSFFVRCFIFRVTMPDYFFENFTPSLTPTFFLWAILSNHLIFVFDRKQFWGVNFILLFKKLFFEF